MVSIALYNLKGGVGKTAAAVNLAYLGAADGLKTLVWDLDPKAHHPFILMCNRQQKMKAGNYLQMRWH